MLKGEKYNYAYSAERAEAAMFSWEVITGEKLIISDEYIIHRAWGFIPGWALCRVSTCNGKCGTYRKITCIKAVKYSCVISFFLIQWKSL